MYESTQEIGQAIQKGLTEKLQYPVGLAISEEEFLLVVKLPGNEAHIRFQLQDLKNLYPSVEDFVAFIEESWKESMKQS